MTILEKLGKRQRPMTDNSRIFDELGRLVNGAAGVADGVRREAETAVRSQMERLVADMDLVKREDFEVLKELVSRQNSEIEALRAELKTFKDAK